MAPSILGIGATEEVHEVRRTVAMLVVAGVLIAGGCGSEQNPTVDETPDTGGQEQESDSGPGY